MSRSRSATARLLVGSSRGVSVILSPQPSERVAMPWATTLNIALDREIEVVCDRTVVRARAVVTPPGARRVSRSRGPVLTVLLDGDAHRAASDGLVGPMALEEHAGSLRAHASDVAQQILQSDARGLSAALELASRVVPLGPARLADARFEQLLTRLQHDPRGSVPLAELADGMRLSRKHLSERFGEVVGLPLRAWFVWRRVRRSIAHLDRAGELARVALDHGFADQSHMARTFSRLVGYSPGSLTRAIVGRS